MESGDESARSQDIKNKPGGALSHSISAITAIHKPKELPASVVPLLQPGKLCPNTCLSDRACIVYDDQVDSDSTLFTL